MDPAVAALVTAAMAGAAGIITSTAGVISAKQRGDEGCRKRLRAIRQEAEDYAHENHELKIRLASQATTFINNPSTREFGVDPGLPPAPSWEQDKPP